jgi:hypothetical protein
VSDHPDQIRRDFERDFYDEEDEQEWEKEWRRVHEVDPSGASIGTVVWRPVRRPT